MRDRKSEVLAQHFSGKGCEAARPPKIDYFIRSVVIPLTIRKHERTVSTDLGSFSSPEHNGSYLNYPSP